MKSELTQKRLMELLHYDEQSGIFTWIVNRQRGKAGRTAGSIDRHGYVTIGIDGGIYFAHRLAWLYMHGEFPCKNMDHINRSRSDNRAVNLRIATHAENNLNKSLDRRNTSGFEGVVWSRHAKKWIAQIGFNKKVHYLGSFDDKYKAAEARALAKEKFHSF